MQLSTDLLLPLFLRFSTFSPARRQLSPTTRGDSYPFVVASFPHNIRFILHIDLININFSRYLYLNCCLIIQFFMANFSFPILLLRFLNNHRTQYYLVRFPTHLSPEMTFKSVGESDEKSLHFPMHKQNCMTNAMIYLKKKKTFSFGCFEQTN